jgi:hypothetical protein
MILRNEPQKGTKVAADGPDDADGSVAIGVIRAIRGYIDNHVPAVIVSRQTFDR